MPMRERVARWSAPAALGVALVAAAGAAGTGLGPPLLKGSGQGTALAAAGSQVAGASTCDVRVLTIGGRPRKLKHVGVCHEDAGDSAVIGLWLGKNAIVEQQVLSPSPHGDTYDLWAGSPRGALHQVGGEWGWTDSDVPPTYGCDRMVAAGGGLVAITSVPNNLGDSTACTGHSSTSVVLVGSVNRTQPLDGAWGVLATNGKRLVLARYGTGVDRTGQLGMFDIDGTQLTAPVVAAADVKTASQGWLTPVGLFLDTKRGLVGPASRVLVKRYSSITIGEGRAVYVRGRTMRVRRLKGGPDRKVMLLPEVDDEVAAGSFGIAVLNGTVSERSAVYRIPWRTIDRVLPR